MAIESRRPFLAGSYLATTVLRADSTGRRNTSMTEVLRCGDHETSACGMGTAGKIRSPGRPPAWQRDQYLRFWTEIARGLSSKDAARSVGVSCAVGSRWFREAGGMRPNRLGPLSARYLSLAEREEIAILNAKGCGVRQIARQAHRSPSTISRELRRNAATRPNASGYRAVTAQWYAERRLRRPKVAKLAANEKLRVYVQDLLAGTITRPDGTEVPGPSVRWAGRRHGPRQDRRWAKSWSPEQISKRLVGGFPR
jgi:DNA-binding CsgD family transcriptional regulator